MADMSASDVMALSRENDGGCMWILVLFALIFGWGNGGWGNNNGFANAIGYENLATSNEVQRGFDNQNQMANQREILSAVTAGTAQSVAATNATFHDMLGVFNDKYSELQRDLAAIAVGQANMMAKQQECCCETLRAIDGVNYNAALTAAQTNANITAQVQKIYDLIQGNRMEDMQQRINQLELAQAMNGVVRYPNGFMYSAGSNPFCSCGGGCYNM